MSISSISNRLKKATGSGSGMVSVEAYNAIIDFCHDLQNRFQRFQPRSSASVTVKTTSDGFTLHAKRPGKKSKPNILPFQISATSAELKAAPGTIDSSGFTETILTDPTVAIWSFVAKITLNATTGLITARAVEWLEEVPADTATVFYHLIASVEITTEGVDATTLYNYTYGPLSSVVYGKYDQSFGLAIF